MGKSQLVVVISVLKNNINRNGKSEHISNLEDCVRIILTWSEWRDSETFVPKAQIKVSPGAYPANKAPPEPCIECETRTRGILVPRREENFFLIFFDAF